MDHVIDVVGAENLTRSLNAVRMSGTISVIGLLGGTSAQIEMFGFVEKNVRLNGILVGSIGNPNLTSNCLLGLVLLPIEGFTPLGCCGRFACAARIFTE